VQSRVRPATPPAAGGNGGHGTAIAVISAIVNLVFDRGLTGLIDDLIAVDVIVRSTRSSCTDAS
jgi:hypothetical protein